MTDRRTGGGHRDHGLWVEDHPPRQFGWIIDGAVSTVAGDLNTALFQMGLSLGRGGSKTPADWLRAAKAEKPAG